MLNPYRISRTCSAQRLGACGCFMLAPCVAVICLFLTSGLRWSRRSSYYLASVQFELLLPSFLARAHRPNGIDGPVTSEPGRSSSSAPAGSLRSVAALGRDMHLRCWGRRRWLVDAGLSDTSDERSQVLSISISQIYHSHPSALCAD